MTLAPQPSEFEIDPVDAEAARAERRLALLAELSEIGMDLARALRAEVRGRVGAETGEAAGSDTAPAAAPALPGAARSSAPPCPDYALMYARLSRAIRLTLALEERLAEGLGACRAKLAENRAKAARQRWWDRRNAVSDIVEQTAEAEIADEEAVDTLVADVNERLNDREDLFDLETRPIGVVAAQICAELGLSPDWSLWAHCAWAREEAGMAGSPFAAPRPEPEAADTG